VSLVGVPSPLAPELTQDTGRSLGMNLSKTWRLARASWTPERDWGLLEMTGSRVPAALRRAPEASFSLAGSTVWC
jgi:hypothetical protein